VGAPGPSWPGRDQEDDESYRYRIHLKLISQSGSNENAIRFDLLQVPGIQDVVFDRRAGTFYCYVYAITPIAAASVLAMVQDAIDQNVAFPLTGIALNPDQIGITLATTISTVAGSTQTDKDTATGQAIAAAQDYINNLRVGEPLVINDIAAAIQTSSSKILDVGQPNHMINEIYIWRSRADSVVEVVVFTQNHPKPPGLATRSLLFFASRSPRRHPAFPGRHDRLVRIVGLDDDDHG
jgi:hypothetical protein